MTKARILRDLAMFWENQREKLLLEEKFFTKKKTQYDVLGKNIH